MLTSCSGFLEPFFLCLAELHVLENVGTSEHLDGFEFLFANLSNFSFTTAFKATLREAFQDGKIDALLHALTRKVHLRCHP